MNKQLEKQKITTFEQLAEQNKEAKEALVQLAKQTPGHKMEGDNIGLFGLTSTGKSTTLNALLDLVGEERAATGAGETTTEFKSYRGPNYTLWDVPGRNDEVAYMSMSWIGFFKGLSRRLILIQTTVKEMSSMMKLLDGIGLRYDIVLNKFDNIDEDERAKLKQQIQKEIQTLDLKGVDRVFFISAKKPQMFPDWLEMVKYLTN